MSRSYLWIVLVGAALAAAGIALLLMEPRGTVVVQAQNPWIIGNAQDPFSYAGGLVHSIEGKADLRIDPSTLGGSLEIQLAPDSALSEALSGVTATRSITLTLDIEDGATAWSNVEVYGDTGIGDSRLPATHAEFAGSGDFELRLDGKRQDTTWHGFWSLGDALRRDDGAVRNRGLVFTPMLRDQTGFSDPSRTELTVLLYSTEDSSAVVLDLVFPDIGADPATNP